MGYSAKALANFFIKNYTNISPLKIQKLVYISHGWHLGLFDEPLVDDEFAEAWRYGPVFPSLYHEFKEFGSDPIDRLAKDSNGPDFDEMVVPKIKDVDTQTPELLNKIWDGYGSFTPGQLSTLTHAKDTPWYNTWNKCKGWRNLHIDNETIKVYYKNLLKQLEPNG